MNQKDNSLTGSVQIKVLELDIFPDPVDKSIVSSIDDVSQDSKTDGFCEVLGVKRGLNSVMKQRILQAEQVKIVDERVRQLAQDSPDFLSTLIDPDPVVQAVAVELIN